MKTRPKRNFSPEFRLEGPQADPALASAHGIDALFILCEGEEWREVSVMDGRLQQ